jgi:GDPmannose 4,6-dehydratase
MPEYTVGTIVNGTLKLLETINELGMAKKIRLYNACSSEVFGRSAPPQNETTIFHPRSSYGVAKAAAFYLVQHYREAYDLFAVNGILFNHESPRRAET